MFHVQEQGCKKLYFQAIALKGIFSARLLVPFPLRCNGTKIFYSRFFILWRFISERKKRWSKPILMCVCTANQAEFKEAEYMSQWGLRCVYRYSWRLPATGLLARGLQVQVKGSTGCLICQTRVDSKREDCDAGK